MAALDKLLRSLVDRRMEALILEPGSRPRMRQNGAEHNVSSSALAGPTIEGLLEQVAPVGAIAGPPAPETVDFGYSAHDRDFRFSCLRTSDGWSVLIVVDDEGSDDGSLGASQATIEQVALEEGEPPGEQLITTVAQLLQLMLDRGASDLHLSSLQQVRVRVDGALRPLEEFAPPLPEWLEQILGDILPDRNRDEYEASNDTDFAYELDDLARFRVNVFRDRYGIGAVFRVIPSEVPSFEDLALPSVLRQVAQLEKGLVLVTGPTGSGKSTTLAALIDLINRERDDHIITIEDPIEFVHESRRCLVHQREVGIHTDSFSQGLVAALREDPDVVLVGEMRDLETVSLALEIAENGHLVFGALPVATATSTIDRLINQFPPDRQAQIRMMLSGCLHLVVSQTLVKRAGGGRLAAREVLVNTPEVATLIREGRTSDLVGAIANGGDKGMTTLGDHLMALVEAGTVEAMDAYVKASRKDEFAEQLRVAGIELESA